MPFVSVGKVQTNVSSAKCSFCNRVYKLDTLQSHINDEKRRLRQEKDQQILKAQKDARAVLEKKAAEKDLRNKLNKKREDDRNKALLGKALRTHKINALRSDL